MNKNIFEQLQVALAPLPYLSFKRANGEEVLILLTSIVSAIRYPEGHMTLRLSNGQDFDIVPPDIEELWRRLQEGIDLAVQRNAQANMNALLSGTKLLT